MTERFIQSQFEPSRQGEFELTRQPGAPRLGSMDRGSEVPTLERLPAENLIARYDNPGARQDIRDTETVLEAGRLVNPEAIPYENLQSRIRVINQGLQDPQAYLLHMSPSELLSEYEAIVLAVREDAGKNPSRVRAINDIGSRYGTLFLKELQSRVDNNYPDREEADQAVRLGLLLRAGETPEQIRQVQETLRSRAPKGATRGRGNPQNPGEQEIRIREDAEGAADWEQHARDLEAATKDGKIEEINRVIKSIPWAQEIPATFINTLVKLSLDKTMEHKNLYGYAVEYAIEQIIGHDADMQPMSAYPDIRSDYYGKARNLKNLKDDVKRMNDDTFTKYLYELEGKRELVHNMGLAMKDRRQYIAFVTQHMRKRGFGFVEDEIVGTRAIQRMYERVLAAKLADRRDGGWLLEQHFREADVQVREMLEAVVGEKLIKKQVLVPEVDENGKVILEGRENKPRMKSYERLPQEWEVMRASRMGRNIAVASQRTAHYLVLGNKPKKSQDSIGSIENEFVVRPIAPLKFIPDRFFTWPGASKFMELFLEEKRRDNQYGIKKKNADGKVEEVGLYGHKVDSTAMLDVGAYDAKSKMWWAMSVFLEQKEYQTIEDNGSKVTIGKYLTDTAVHVKEKAEKHFKDDFRHKHRREPTREEITIHMHHHQDHITKDINESIRGVIKDQRLFLGVLLRFDDPFELDEANKALIWNNVAELMPSRIAAFLPKDTITRVEKIFPGEDAQKKWEEIRVKLWIAEEARVAADTEGLKTDENGKPVQRKDINGNVINEPYTPKALAEYFSIAGISGKEIALIQEIQKLGRESIAFDKAGEQLTVDTNNHGYVKFMSGHREVSSKEVGSGLVKTKFVFTPFLDDVPKTEWENGKEADLERLVVIDQGGLEEGYGVLFQLFENSAIPKPEDAAKIFHDAFEKLKGPLGNPTVQKQIKPFYNAFIEIVRAEGPIGLAKYPFFNDFFKAFRIARSKMEKYNLSSNVAYDPEQVLGFGTKLAQWEIIADDQTEVDKNGNTPFMEFRKRFGVDKLKMLMWHIRLIAMIFGPVMAIEFIKIVMPGDLTKQLNLG